MRAARESRDTALRALVCGWSRKVLNERVFAMLVCHADDSDKGGPNFTVGGLVAPIDGWHALEGDWQSALDASPKLNYFKFAEAFGRHGQFRRSRFTISQRNARVGRFIKAINNHCMRADAAISDTVAHKAVMAGKVSVAVEQPFTATYLGMMAIVANNLTKGGYRGKVEFILDAMDETTLLDIRSAYISMIAAPRAPFVERFGQPPITRDDRLVIALQAADLWAGLARRIYEDSIEQRITVARKWLSMLRIQNSIGHVTKAKLETMAQVMVERAARANIQFESSKARRKRHAPEREKLRAKKAFYE